MNLSRKCTKLRIQNYCGRYNGPEDLRNFKGVIHIPYSWSNLALFENMQSGIPYFIPSQFFMKTLLAQGAFLPDSRFASQYLNVSEWYSGKYDPFIVYFDSWYDLILKTRSYNYVENKQKILELAKQHQEKTFSLWEAVIVNLTYQ